MNLMNDTLQELHNKSEEFDTLNVNSAKCIDNIKTQVNDINNTLHCQESNLKQNKEAIDFFNLYCKIPNFIYNDYFTTTINTTNSITMIKHTTIQHNKKKFAGQCYIKALWEVVGQAKKYKSSFWLQW
jgi:uncharacterized protein YdcH (DUF465 family)